MFVMKLKILQLNKLILSVNISEYLTMSGKNALGLVKKFRILYLGKEDIYCLSGK